MKLRYALLLCALAHCALIIATAEQQESKYNEIIKLLSDSTEQLKPAAQSYSASVADPNEYSSSGYNRGSSERSRYAPSSSSSSANKKAADDDEDKKTEEDEEDKKPDRLALLLAESKFACDGLKNGYYADESVGCQVFHYCVDGVKHSWQCPENTVFHQIHLNCVPNTQDICRDSSKFHVVNDYLHKELNERGPNNTILYHQRFYPEGFDVSGGDTVTQIFQAQAAAALQKARERETADRDSADYEEEQPRPRPRAHNKPSYTPSTQAVRQPLPRQPVYKQPASRPISSYQPQPPPTKRPVAYTTPEAFTPPSYTESSNDDYNSNSNDFSPSSSSSSGSSSSSSPSFSPNSGSSFNSGSSSGFSPSSSSSSSGFSGHSSSHHSQPSSSFRSGHSSSSTRPNYPTRSLGIPIASFRVAPSSSSSSGYSPMSAQASTIREVNVPLDMPIAFTGNQRTLQGYYF